MKALVAYTEKMNNFAIDTQKYYFSAAGVEIKQKPLVFYCKNGKVSKI